MLTKEQVQGLIVMCVVDLCGCGSRSQEIPIDAQIKAYLLVLTGRRWSVGDSTARIYDIAGIKYREEDKKIVIEDDELDRIGLKADENQQMSLKSGYPWGVRD